MSENICVVGETDNELIYTKDHGLHLGDIIEFPKNDILCIWDPKVLFL